MKIQVEVLGWKNKCCGCCNDIKADEETYIITQVVGISGSIHLCEECISQLNFKGIQLKNINLTGISKLEQLKKCKEELKELNDVLIEDEFYSNVDDKDKKEIKDHIIEEFWDVVQSHLGLLEKHGITAEDVMKEYEKHLEKIKLRPRKKQCDKCINCTIYELEANKEKLYTCEAMPLTINDFSLAKGCKFYKESELIE